MTTPVTVSCPCGGSFVLDFEVQSGVAWIASSPVCRHCSTPLTPEHVAELGRSLVDEERGR